MLQHSGKLVLGILGLTVLGVLLGMGLREWIVPHLPASVARLVDYQPTSETPGETGAESGHEVAFWKSSMIPNFVSPRPGKDPMGMDLIPVYKDELGEEKLITLNLQTRHNMGLRTAPVERASGDRVVRTFGQVAYAEPLLGDVTLKVGGWIEKLDVDFVGQYVKKGQPLFSLYSPDLVSAEEEYIASLSDSGSKSTLLGSANVFSGYDKLRYWDVPLSEIEKVKRAGKIQKGITFVSPFSGWVIEKNALEGMHMKAGSRFYRIADLSRMWVYVSVYAYQLPQIHEGQTARVTLPFNPGQVFEGKVIYVYPFINPKTRQVRVRLEFPNPDLVLKPEMYANVEIVTNPENPHLLVPLDAVIYVGQHQQFEGASQKSGYAYVQLGKGRYEPREVVIGAEVEGGKIQVLSGLKEGEQVVVSGQFQLDAERKVKEANLKMLTQGK